MRLARTFSEYDNSQLETNDTSLPQMKALKTARPTGQTPKREITKPRSATARTAEELMELAVEAARSRHHRIFWNSSRCVPHACWERAGAVWPFTWGAKRNFMRCGEAVVPL